MLLVRNGTAGKLFGKPLRQLWYPSPTRTSCLRTITMNTTVTLSSEKVRLSREEESLFEMLMEVVHERELKTTVRVAGGWVRDKLLGLPTNDIDVALDDLTGEAFARHVNEVLEQKGLETHRVAVIQANPEQSKHLETATVSVLGHELDFVNLRSETYKEGCRIPDMKFGSPLEDALRRDFTINALFYNINERIVEDFTGRGIKDLETGVIRTPLPASDTFSDDPLRMLRAIRFATRFNFSCDEDIIRSLREASIQMALLDKVSLERIGIELHGMLQGPHPLEALHMLIDNGLLQHILRFNPTAKIQCDSLGSVMPNSTTTESNDSPQLFVVGRDAPKLLDDAKAAQCLLFAQVLLDYYLPNSTFGKLKLESSEQDNDAVNDQLQRQRKNHCTATQDPALLVLAGAILPLAGETFVDARGRKEEVVKHVIFDSLKLKRCYKPVVDSVATGFKFSKCITDNSFDRPTVGHLILEAGELWRLGLVLGISLCMMNAQNGSLRRLDVSTLESRVVEMEKQVDEWGLADLWKQPPHLSGKEIMKLVGLKNGGPYVGLLLTEQQNIMIAQPTITRESCERLLKEFSVRNPVSEFMRKLNQEKKERLAIEKEKKRVASEKAKAERKAAKDQQMETTQSKHSGEQAMKTSGKRTSPRNTRSSKKQKTNKVVE